MAKIYSSGNTLFIGSDVVSIDSGVLATAVTDTGYTDHVKVANTEGLIYVIAPYNEIFEEDGTTNWGTDVTTTVNNLNTLFGDNNPNNYADKTKLDTAVSRINAAEADIATNTSDIATNVLDISDIKKAVQIDLSAGRGIFADDNKGTNKGYLKVADSQAVIQGGVLTRINISEASPGSHSFTVAAGPAGSETEYEALELYGKTNAGTATLELKNGTALGFVNGSYATTFRTDTLTAARTIALPDASGTVALTSDIPSFVGYVDTTGTPANNQVAVFTDQDTIEGSTALIVDGANVGVGTTSPTEKLDVDGNIRFGNGDYLITKDPAGTYGMQMRMSSYNLIFNKNGSYGFSSYGFYDDQGNPLTYISAGHTLQGRDNAFIFGKNVQAPSNGYFGFQTYAGTPEYLAIKNSRVDSNNEGLSFHTRLAGVDSETMRIAYDGKVGIGTTTPSAPLTVIGNSYLKGDVAVGPQATAGAISGYTLSVRDTVPSIYLKDQSALVGDGRLHVEDNVFSIGADPGNVTTDAVLRFETRGSERMRIDHDGNVGIGTATPSAKLDVQGAIYSDTSINIGKTPVGGRYLNVRTSSLNSGSALYTGGIHSDGRWALYGTANTSTHKLLTIWHTGEYVGYGQGGNAASIGSPMATRGTTGEVYFSVNKRLIWSNTGLGPLNTPVPLIIKTDTTRNVAEFYSTTINNTNLAQAAGFEYSANFHRFRTGDTTDGSTLPNTQEGLYISQAGLVGMGTTSPTANLHVKSESNSSNSYALKVTNLANNDILRAENDGDVYVRRSIFIDHDGGAADGQLTFREDGGPTMTIKGAGNLTFSTGATTAGLTFADQGDGKQKNIVFSKNTGGLVSIGYANNTNGDGGFLVQQQNSTQSNGNQLFMTAYQSHSLITSRGYGGTGTGRDMVFAIRGSNTTSDPEVEVMRLTNKNATSPHSVGIGTSTPTAKLDVAGLVNINDGSNNVLISSGNSTITVGGTTAVGYRALTALTTGEGNTAVGVESLRDTTTGIRNTVVGNSAGAVVNSSYNSIYGYQAGQLFSSNNNTAMGYVAGKYSSGGNNVLIGAEAGEGVSSTSTFSNTTAVGYQALTSLTTGIGNTAVGYQTLLSATTNQRNTAVGYQTLRNNTSGSDNTAIGFQSLIAVTSGNYNTAIGFAAGDTVTTGSNNTLVGHGAGSSLSNHSGNVMIGYNAGYNETSSNKLYIENSNSTTPLIYGEFDNDILRVNGELQVGDPTGTGFKLPTTDGTADQVLSTDGSGNVTWVDITLEGLPNVVSALTNNEILTYNSTLGYWVGGNSVTLNSVNTNNLTVNSSATFSSAISAPSFLLTSDGESEISVGVLSDDLALKSAGNVRVLLDKDNNETGQKFLVEDPSSTERFSIDDTGVATFNNAYSLPNADGTSGQVLTTNGSGTASWADAGGGGKSSSASGYLEIKSDSMTQLFVGPTNGIFAADYTTGNNDNQSYSHNGTAPTAGSSTISKYPYNVRSGLLDVHHDISTISFNARLRDVSQNAEGCEYWACIWHLSGGAAETFTSQTWTAAAVGTGTFASSSTNILLSKVVATASGLSISAGDSLWITFGWVDQPAGTPDIPVNWSINMNE